MDGNVRYVRGPPGEGRDEERREATTQAQPPFAAILSCSDSRVAPEIVVESGLGELFVVRVAGNAAAAPIVHGSIECAVSALGSPLVMALGHQGCGATGAALGAVAGTLGFKGQPSALVIPLIDVAQSV